MSIREILHFPDSLLLQVSDPVERVTPDIQKLMDDMLETMYSAEGSGLAAIQVGVPLRIVVMDLAREGESPQPQYFVNPQLSNLSKGTSVYREACLSVPNLGQKPVERPATCRVDFLDYDGESQQLECDGLLATCIQHEIDHLNGILYFQRLSRFKRHRIEKSLRKYPAQVARTKREAEPFGDVVFLQEALQHKQPKIGKQSQETRIRAARSI